MSDFDPWAVLGVRPGAQTDEVRAAWKDLARQYHPDKFAMASAEDRSRASAHMTVVNAAYEEIRSGRARIPGGDFGSGGRRAETDLRSDRAAGIRDDWFADDVLRSAEQWILRRHRQRLRRKRLWVVVGLVVLVVGAGLVHLGMSRDYGYALAWSSEGTRVVDVDCGDRYDRGQSMAADLRARGELAEAQLVEDVCGQWVGAARLLMWPALALVAGLIWVFFLRPR